MWCSDKYGKSYSLFAKVNSKYKDWYHLLVNKSTLSTFVVDVVTAMDRYNETQQITGKVDQMPFLRWIRNTMEHYINKPEVSKSVPMSFFLKHLEQCFPQLRNDIINELEGMMKESPNANYWDAWKDIDWKILKEYK